MIPNQSTTWRHSDLHPAHITCKFISGYIWIMVISLITYHTSIYKMNETRQLSAYSRSVAACWHTEPNDENLLDSTHKWKVLRKRFQVMTYSCRIGPPCLWSTRFSRIMHDTVTCQRSINRYTASKAINHAPFSSYGYSTQTCNVSCCQLS